MFHISKRWRDLLAVAAASTAMGLMVSAPTAADFCFRDSYGRGAGKVPTACADSGRAMDEGLCYNKCPAGYDGKGTVCVANCPPGFRDDGLYCAKPEGYSVGIGKLTQALCKSDTGCHQVAGLWYPKCKPGHINVGGAFCSPDCPRTWSDIGVSCKKPSENRGVGVLPNGCAVGQKFDAGLCYDNCKASYDGVGPVCWQSCPARLPQSCGAIGCAADSEKCAQALFEPISTAVVAMSEIPRNLTLSKIDQYKDFGELVRKRVNTSQFKHLSRDAFAKMILDMGLLIQIVFNGPELTAIYDAMFNRDFDLDLIRPEKLAALGKAYKRPKCGA
jgi:hypothetical protein